jgi:hypothetical protein
MYTQSEPVFQSDRGSFRKLEDFPQQFEDEG